MAESSQPAYAILLEGFYRISKTLPLAEAPNYAQLLYIVTSEVSFAEEPDVGNPQVRFCEGH